MATSILVRNAVPAPALDFTLPPLEKVTGDLCTQLAATAPAGVDQAVTDTLQAIAETLRLDWAVLWSPSGAEPRVSQHASVNHPSSVAMAALLAGPAVAAKLERGEPVWCDQPGDLPGRAAGDGWLDLRSAAIVPVVSAGDMPEGRAMLVVGCETREHRWNAATIEALRLVAAAIGQAVARRAGADALRRVRDEVQALRRRGGATRGEERASVHALSAWGLVASESPAVRQALQQVEQVAPTSATVLLLGETGVGKERFAEAIHELSARAGRQMVRVSCAAIPATLIESELFGRERGAYTGALTRQAGRFEAAGGSTLFLDEIGELSADVQSKLLRALEERVIERLGSTQSIDVDVRIVAATHRDLEKAVIDGTFRQDLFYRLNVFPISIPPLRERVEDIPGLAWKFIDEFSAAIGRSIHSIANESMRQLKAYPWPGNIRELRNVIERAVILSKGPVLTVPMPQSSLHRAAVASTALKDVETAHIRGVLESVGWRIRGKAGAAERLGLKPSTLETRMAKLGLSRPRAV